MAPHREGWQEHPHFPQQTLLLESHDAFVARARDLEERCRTIGAGEGLTERQVKRFAGRLADEFRNWQWTMGCHERYEENKLYPFLEGSFGARCDQLADEHEALHRLADACVSDLEAAASEVGDGSAYPTERVLGTLQSYVVALRAHLQREEELVIPLLLSMSPEEFGRYEAKESCALPPASSQ